MATTAPKKSYGGKGPNIMIGGWVMCGLGIFLVALRLWAASKRAGKLRWDFLWITIAIVLATISHACFTYAILKGIGNHLNQLNPTDLFEALHWIWITIFVGIFSAIAAKLAIIALLLEVQSPTAKIRRFALWALGIFLFVVGIVQVALTLLKCIPMTRLWNPTLPGSCPGAELAATFTYFQGSLHAAVDVGLSIFPISIVWNLQTDMKTKVCFCLLMACGAIPSVAVIIRTTLLYKLDHPKDVTWDLGTFMIWASCELWSVIIIGCIPPLRPLFLRFFANAKTHITSSHGRSGARTRTEVTPGNTNMQLSNLDHKKGGGAVVTTRTAALFDVEKDGSTDNVMANDHLSHGGIMVQTDVEVQNGWSRPSDSSSSNYGTSH